MSTTRTAFCCSSTEVVEARAHERQMSNHADQHDLDKLARWHRDLSGGEPGTFPVYCMFLVSPEDRASHQVFREFRSSFEARAAGFEHLVIFGQHGISATLHGLVAEFGLSRYDVPFLVLFSPQAGATVHALPLRAGDDGGQPPSSEADGAEPWRQALSSVERVADRKEHLLMLDLMPEVTPHTLEASPLAETVGRVLARLS